MTKGGRRLATTLFDISLLRFKKFTSSPRCEVYFVTPVRSLLRQLAADFAARVGRGVNVDVVFAGHQGGGLGVGQRGAAFGRARSRVRDRTRDAGVLAGFSRAMEMPRSRRSGETGVG